MNLIFLTVLIISTVSTFSRIWIFTVDNLNSFEIFNSLEIPDNPKILNSLEIFDSFYSFATFDNLDIPESPEILDNLKILESPLQFRQFRDSF